VDESQWESHVTWWVGKGTPAVAAPPHSPSPLQDFVVGLSILLRGTVHEKLKWAFNLYDINKDGCITKEVLGWQACLPLLSLLKPLTW
jgi:hypothetical protein